MTSLQFQILMAMRQLEPHPMSDFAIFSNTGGFELGGHGATCVAACLDLELRGFIERTQDKRWKLTDSGRGCLPSGEAC